MQEEVWGVAAQLVGLGLGVLLLVSLGILLWPGTRIDSRTLVNPFMLKTSDMQFSVAYTDLIAGYCRAHHAFPLHTGNLWQLGYP